MSNSPKSPSPSLLYGAATGRTSGAWPRYPALGGQGTEETGPTGRTSGDQPGNPATGGALVACAAEGFFFFFRARMSGHWTEKQDGEGFLRGQHIELNIDSAKEFLEIYMGRNLSHLWSY